MNCRWWRLSGALSFFLPAAVDAQSPALYRSGPTEYFQVVTTTTRTLVPGVDTMISRTVRHCIVQRNWDDDGDGLHLILRVESPGPAPTVSTDTLRITRTGQSRAEPGPAGLTDPGARFDAVPRLPLPPGPLAPGTRWLDSLSVEGTTEGGRLHHEFGRRYTVRRWADTLGRRVLEVEGLGSMRPASPLPSTPWTIAEPGMEKALVPLLEQLPDDG